MRVSPPFELHRNTKKRIMLQVAAWRSLWTTLRVAAHRLGPTSAKK
jgi:hypothetical protein